MAPRARPTNNATTPGPSPSIAPRAAMGAIEDLRREAADPRSLYERGEQAREAWKSKALTVLAGALGNEADLTKRIRQVRFYPMMSGMGAEAYREQFVEGITLADGLLEGALLHLSLLQQELPRENDRTLGTARPPDPRRVFIVHGRNHKAHMAMSTFLRSVGLEPVEWSQAVLATGRPNPYIGEILDAGFALAQVVVVLLTPDDEARLRTQFHGAGEPPHETRLTGQARPNVLFEAGMAMGRNENRTVLVELGECRPFSDVSGRHVIHLTDSSQKRQELANRLALTGAQVDLTGVDWHEAGSFSDAVADTT